MTFTTHGMLAGKKIRRLGFGTMRLTGPGIWGPPADEQNAIEVLRSAVALGVQHIDTADAYGPHDAERLIRKALYPYAEDLIIATKGGFTRQGPGQWTPCGVPAYLRQCVEMSLRRLGVEAIDLYYLHRVDPSVPLADQVGELEQLRAEGKIKALGLSKVTVAQIIEAAAIAPIAAVQNAFSRLNTESKDVVQWCEENSIAFVPYAPLGAGKYLESEDASATSRSALRWLLEHSPATLPIPGTSRIEHLAENMGADVEPTS
ncbi:aldo/keto reductase [Pseudomonas sp. B21-023]|uniref:aldo/keto reductase n=1 Tax=unclassified Pseudomonas TaxID=196821 RepID=UPI001553A135|nr:MULTISPECIES: aldo/keto reductase [unclassified Pseudomonas]NQD75326.1 aldo/keto reductase [Pseudomonas sp. CM27]UVM14346.1 aldo/keto reductase [Pseudomonas sp. B21-023]